MQTDKPPKQMILAMSDLMSELYDVMVSIFGRSDGEIRLINKMLRDLITDQANLS